MPEPLTAEHEAELFRWLVASANGQPDVVAELACTCVAIAARHHALGPPKSAADLNPFTGGQLATEVFGTRRRWNEGELARYCAIAGLACGPQALLATRKEVSYVRAASFDLYATTGLYRDGGAVPAALARSHGDDERAEDAVDDLLTRTTQAAIATGCSAPIVAIDQLLGDQLIDRLVAGNVPFAAAVGPDWSHSDFEAYDTSPLLLGNTPLELFMYDRGRHILVRSSAEGRRVEMVRLRLRDRSPYELTLACVAHAPTPFFVVRAACDENAPTQRRLDAAAELAVLAAGLDGESPLDDVGLEEFYASPNEGPRWTRYTTCVQATLTHARVRLNGEAT